MAALEKRPFGKGLLSRSFADQWAQLSFDTAVHRSDALQFLIDTEESIVFYWVQTLLAGTQRTDTDK